MRVNPNAVVFWFFLALVGYLMGGLDGAIIGLAFGTGVSFLASFF